MLEELLGYRDDKYRVFQIKSIPNIDGNSIIGVRVPILDSIAKKYNNSIDKDKFMLDLPHKYYDENMLHSKFISLCRDYEICINYINSFLPYVDNWAVCDTINPKIFSKYKDRLIFDIKRWIKDKNLYSKRFGIRMLMNYYLDIADNDKYLEMPSKIKTNDYYLQMMIAWYYATALVYKYDVAIKYLENNCLSTWIHNKTISKCIDSYRISDDKKDYLRKLRRK